MSVQLTFDNSAADFIVESFGYSFVNGMLLDTKGKEASCKFCKRTITYGHFGGILGDARPLITEFICKNTECLIEVSGKIKSCVKEEAEPYRGKKIELNQCKKGYLYKLDSMYIGSGVFDGDDGFIGIREKNDDFFLDTDYHVDSGDSEAIPLEEICPVPEGIGIFESEDGTWDSVSGREMEFDKPKSEGGKGWYFKDTGESSREDEECHPSVVENDKLFDWLTEKEKEHNGSC